jgi:hypothetical protein
MPSYRAATAFLFMLPLTSLLSRRSLNHRAAAPFIVAPPVLPSLARCRCLHCRTATAFLVVPLRNGGNGGWNGGWNGQMAEWRNGRMVEMAAEWRNGEMAEWRNGGMAEMADGMADGIEEWQNGGMAEWRNGRNGSQMAEWLNGGNGYLPTIFMVHANDDDDDDDNTNTFKSFIVLTSR